MNNLTIINHNGQKTIDSREVAEMIDMQHKDLLEKIRGYLPHLTSGKFRPLDFFIESTYQDAKGEERPCYLLTRKGCDMVANKLTGEKGVLFSAAYINKFHEMEQAQIPRSLPEALRLARFFAEDDAICVVLGDNIIENNICAAVQAFHAHPRGARILLKEVPDPQRFGVPELDGDRIVRIEEKPAQPKSNYAVIGIYLYDNAVFQIIDTLTPSDRNELEITDVNNAYIARGEMAYSVLDGWWTDAGTFESLLRANTLVAETGANKLA